MGGITGAMGGRRASGTGLFVRGGGVQHLQKSGTNEARGAKSDHDATCNRMSAQQAILGGELPARCLLTGLQRPQNDHLHRRALWFGSFPVVTAGQRHLKQTTITDF